MPGMQFVKVSFFVSLLVFWGCTNSSSTGKIKDSLVSEPGIAFTVNPEPAGPRLTSLVDSLVSSSSDQKVQVILLAAWLGRSISPVRVNPFEPGETPDNYIERVLESFNGACGTIDFVFERAVGLLGLSHRRVVFPFVPGTGGHVASEVFINGKWVFLDGTFGVYFTHAGRADDLLSIEEARRLYPAIDIWSIARNRWSRQNTSMSELWSEYRNRDLFHITRDNFFKNPLNENRTVITDLRLAYFSVPAYFDRNEVLADEVTIDLNLQSNGHMGEKDMNYGDLLQPQDLGYGPTVFAELPYMGGHSSLNGFILERRFNFVTTSQRQLTFKIDLVNIPSELQKKSLLEHVKFADQVYRLNETFVKSDWTNRSVTYQFNIRPPMTTFRLRLPHEQKNLINIYFDAITWQQVPKIHLLPEGLTDNFEWIPPEFSDRGFAPLPFQSDLGSLRNPK